MNDNRPLQGENWLANTEEVMQTCTVIVLFPCPVAAARTEAPAATWRLHRGKEEIIEILLPEALLQRVESLYSVEWKWKGLGLSERQGGGKILVYSGEKHHGLSCEKHKTIFLLLMKSTGPFIEAFQDIKLH